MTLVTAVIRDTAGNTYANAVVEASYLSNIPSGTGTGPPLASGSVFQTFAVTETDTFGNLSMNLTDLAVITPTGGSWFFNVLNNTRTIGFSMNSFAVTGASVDLTAAFAAASAPLFPAINLNAVGAITFTEQAAPAGAAGKDVLWGDSTAHRLKVKNNNGGADTLAQFSDNLGVFAPTTSAQLAGIVSDETGSGPLVFATGPVISPASQNGLAILYADQFANVSAAITAAPSSGAIIDCRSPNVNLALGSIDAGTKAITLLLGPFTYTATQITLETNFCMTGAGPLNQTGVGQTKITSVGSNATPLMVIPQSNSNPAQGISISRIRFVGAAANTTQKGLFADCSTLTNSGLWYSTFTECNFDGFVGNPIHLKGRTDGASAVNQFLTFNDVRAFRPASGAEALRIENGCGQLKFINCEFDGPGITDGTNIFIGQLNGGDLQAPYSIDFDLLTCQSANLGIQLSGVLGVTFKSCHFEALHGAIQTSLVGTIPNFDVVIDGDNWFAGTVGVNAGNGFIVKDTASNSRIKLKNNLIQGTPDKIVNGTNGSTYHVADNVQTTSPQAFASANITTGLNPAATLNIQDYRTIFLQTSATAITTLQSSLGPGEIINFRANGTPVIFGTGGNLNLGSYGTPLVLNTGESAQFVIDDSNGGLNLVSVNRGATMVNLTAQSANIGTTTLYAVPSTTARSYRVHVYATLQRAATTSSTMPSVLINWTDKNNTTAQSLTSTPSNPNSNSLSGSTWVFLTFMINCQASTNITYSTTGYASVGGTSMQYSLVISVEPL